ncbi:hypothetical protein NQ315_016107 [Exocentrus adspersus]|uniref:Uncharacterized protein n=1 Tax=Exocentrus adspersus TaxID=1586481 RepID=A0AAV8V7F9_9CUCU|nr:hypothetical protein NQ315_016107 [Exocentrus adspersus]
MALNEVQNEFKDASEQGCTYELIIRGIAISTVEEMRKSLSMARRLELSGDSVKYPDYPYTAEEDVEAVTKSLDELQPLVGQFSDSSYSNNFHTYQSKLSHLLHRLEHVDDGETTRRSELLARTLTILDELHRRAEEFTKSKSVSPQLSFLEQNEFSANIHPTRQSSSSSPPRASPVAIKPILPNKWALKFSGDKKGLSLSAFLERVEELRVARHVSKEILLESGIDLFTGRAYQFYLAYRSQVTTWDDFVGLLREEYLSANYNEKLFEEIRHRT